MKSVKFLLLWTLVLSCLQVGVVHGMDMNKLDQETLDDQLIDAFTADNFERFSELVSLGANINTLKLWDRSILTCALIEGLDKWITYLIDNGADVNCKNKDGFSPLAEILLAGRGVCCDIKYPLLLLEHNANPNILVHSSIWIETQSGRKRGNIDIPLLLKLAIESGESDELARLNCARFTILLNCKAIDLDIKNSEGKTVIALCLDERLRLPDNIKKLLFIKKMFPEHKIESYLVWAKNQNLVKYALNQFISKIAKGDKGFEPLVPFLEYLDVESSVNNQPESCPLETLIDIIDDKHPNRDLIYKCFEFLLTDALNPVCKTRTNAHLSPCRPLKRGGCTLAELIIRKKETTLFKCCAKNIDFQQRYYHHLRRDIKGRTFLHCCIEHDFAEGVKVIYSIDNNKALEVTDAKERTPLVYAIELGHVECVQVLLNHRCNPNPTCNITIQDQAGDTITVKNVLELAQHSCPAAVQIIKAAQATTLGDLPHDIIRTIISHIPHEGFLPPRTGDADRMPGRVLMERFAHIKKITDQNAIPLFQAAVSGLTKNSLELNQWLLATQRLTDAQKYAVLRDCLRYTHQDDRFCLLLNDNPHLVIYEPETVPFLVSLFVDAICPSEAILQVAINCTIHMNYQRRADISINAPSNLVWREDRTGTKYTLAPDDQKSDGPNAMDIALLRLAHPRGGDKQKLKDAILLLKGAGGVFSTHSTYIKEDDLNTLKLSKDYKKPILELVIVNSLTTNNLDALELLIQQPNIDLNAPIHGIHTPLTWLCSDKNSTKAHVELLLKYRKKRLNIDEKNGAGSTALDCILAMEDTPRSQAIIELLRNNGAFAPNDLAYQLPPLYALFEPENTAATPAVGVPVVATIPGAPQQPNPAQAIASNPDGAPVPSTTPPAINTHYFGSKSIAWLAGLSLCAGTAYGIWRYCHPEEQDDDGVENNALIEDKSNSIHGARDEIS